MKTIMLLEKSQLLLEGLTGLFARSKRFEVVARGRSLALLHEGLADIPPRYVIIGSSLLTDKQTSEAALQTVCAAAGNTEKGTIYSVVLLGRHDHALVDHYRCLGFSGLVCEQSSFHEFEQALTALHLGGRYLPSVLAERPDGGGFHPAGRNLTVREMQVLQRISMGRSSKEIAACLGIAVSTVDVYRKRLLEKLSVHSVAELTKCALRMGLTAL